MQLFKKKSFSQFFFFWIFEIQISVWIFPKKRWRSYLIYFWTYRLRKTWLDQCLKSPVSENPLTSDVVNGTKHCWNLNDSTFTIFIDPCEGNSVGKSLSEWYAKSKDCLLTHWLQLTSFLFLKDAIYCTIFRCIYLKNGKYLPNFFFYFRNLESFLMIFKKKMTLVADAFLNLPTPKNTVR